MACWIKLTYERNVYVIDLDRVAAFWRISKGRVAFCLPHAEQVIIVNQQNDPDIYQTILDYVEKVTGYELES